MGLIPHPTIKKAPRELAAKEESSVKFQPIQPLGSRGLYTQEEIGKVQNLFTFGLERKVVENIITRRVAGMEAGGQGFSTLGMFNPEELKDLAHSTIKQMWGWFSDLGVFMSGLIGFYFIFRIIKYILGVIINGFHLYRTIGGGFAMLACLWNSLTMWVIHYYYMKNSEPVKVKDNESGGTKQDSKSVPEANANNASVASVHTSGDVAAGLYPNLRQAPHWTETETRDNSREQS